MLPSVLLHVGAIKVSLMIIVSGSVIVIESLIILQELSSITLRT